MKHYFIIGFAALFTAAAAFSSYYWFERNSPCANSISCITNLNSVVEDSITGTFLGQPVSVPDLTSSGSVLGQGTPDEDFTTPVTSAKHIYVDLNKQILYGYEGTRPVIKSLVSTGRWGRTPTGEFKIWIKLKATRMSGGSGSDYYNLPNVPYTMFFYNASVPRELGYALHGAY